MHERCAKKQPQRETAHGSSDEQLQHVNCKTYVGAGGLTSRLVVGMSTLDVQPLLHTYLSGSILGGSGSIALREMHA